MTRAAECPGRPSVSETSTLQRRGLLAAGAAFVAGLVAKFTEAGVSAGVDGDVVLGTTNTAVAMTEVVCSTADQRGLQGVCTVGSFGWGVSGVGTQYGVMGFAASTGIAGTQRAGAGVYGDGFADSSPGVLGTSIYAGGIGVRGVATGGPGVVGQSGSSPGMLGVIPSSSAANTVAVFGQNSSTYAGPSAGAGGFGVYGISAKGHGLVGATAAPGAAAVVGATNGVAGAYAGVFYGPVIVSGGFTVVGGPKSAAVPHPDGSHRRLYCMESPESWFEDFGSAQLDCGRAHIVIDPDFAAVVDLSNYHVFLTTYDSDHQLSVRNRMADGFDVHADVRLAALKGQREDELSAAFSWRIVARRKDIGGSRFERVTIPPKPVLPTVPSVTLAPPPARTAQK